MNTRPESPSEFQRILRERARRLAQPLQVESPGDTRAFVVAALSGEHYGFAVEDVLEVSAIKKHFKLQSERSSLTTFFSVQPPSRVSRMSSVSRPLNKSFDSVCSLLSIGIPSSTCKLYYTHMLITRSFFR